jgi:flagellin
VSSIVLSASVRQNLLSLQSTASLLATTQNDLSTGNKVNSAIDNPNSYFTATALNNRAGDISNLLDGIGNGVQVLQAANTGITSLQQLVSNAQSIASQVLQAPVGYSTKANAVSAPITNGGSAVPATDLRGLGTVLSNAVTGSTVNATAPVAQAVNA